MTSATTADEPVTSVGDVELQLAEARQAELSSFVEVYRALGGGWQQEGRPTN